MYSVITAIATVDLARMGQIGWWNWYNDCSILNRQNLKWVPCSGQKLLVAALEEQFALLGGTF